VDRYHYFPSSLQAFGLAGGGAQSHFEAGTDEPAATGTLAAVARALVDVHARFFDAAGPGGRLERRDAREVLARVRRATLAGVVITFTRCWPVGAARPQAQPLWQLALALGATVSEAYDPSLTTHVVAGAAGTDKARAAAAAGKHVVSPKWLATCKLTWQRADEAAHPPRPAPPPPPGRGGGGRGGNAGANGGSGPQDDAEQDLRRALAAAGRV